MNVKKIYRDVMSGKNDNNMKFNDVCHLLDALKFKLSVKGDHYIYRKDNTPIINIQPDGNKAKGYQVRQIRNVLTENRIEV